MESLREFDFLAVNEMQFPFHQCATTNMILFYLCYSRVLLDFNPDYRNLDFIVFHHKHMVTEVSDSEICCQFRFVFTWRMLCFKTHCCNRWWFMKFRRDGCSNSEPAVSSTLSCWYLRRIDGLGPHLKKCKCKKLNILIY